MIPLLLFIALAVLVLVAFEWRARQESRSSNESHTPNPPLQDEGCCGMHLVCERETLLQTNAEIIYYDDEELDALSGIDPQLYSSEQHALLRHVFDTLLEKDVPGWVRSLQLRNIQLPQDIREEALLIVQERRHWTSNTSSASPKS